MLELKLLMIGSSKWILSFFFTKTDDMYYNFLHAELFGFY